MIEYTTKAKASRKAKSKDVETVIRIREILFDLKGEVCRIGYDRRPKGEDVSPKSRDIVVPLPDAKIPKDIEGFCKKQVDKGL